MSQFGEQLRKPKQRKRARLEASAAALLVCVECVPRRGHQMPLRTRELRNRARGRHGPPWSPVRARPSRDEPVDARTRSVFEQAASEIEPSRPRLHSWHSREHEALERGSVGQVELGEDRVAAAQLPERRALRTGVCARLCYRRARDVSAFCPRRRARGGRTLRRPKDRGSLRDRSSAVRGLCEAASVRSFGYWRTSSASRPQWATFKTSSAGKPVTSSEPMRVPYVREAREVGEARGR